MWHNKYIHCGTGGRNLKFESLNLHSFCYLYKQVSTFFWPSFIMSWLYKISLFVHQAYMLLMVIQLLKLSRRHQFLFEHFERNCLKKTKLENCMELIVMVAGGVTYLSRYLHTEHLKLAQFLFFIKKVL